MISDDASVPFDSYQDFKPSVNHQRLEFSKQKFVHSLKLSLSFEVDEGVSVRDVSTNYIYRES